MLRHLEQRYQRTDTVSSTHSILKFTGSPGNYPLLLRNKQKVPLIDRPEGRQSYFLWSCRSENILQNQKYKLRNIKQRAGFSVTGGVVCCGFQDCSCLGKWLKRVQFKILNSYKLARKENVFSTSSPYPDSKRHSNYPFM
jgi:hypothetical protein